MFRDHHSSRTTKNLLDVGRYWWEMQNVFVFFLNKDALVIDWHKHYLIYCHEHSVPPSSNRNINSPKDRKIICVIRGTGNSYFIYLLDLHPAFLPP